MERQTNLPAAPGSPSGLQPRDSVHGVGGHALHRGALHVNFELSRLEAASSSSSFGWALVICIS